MNNPTDPRRTPPDALALAVEIPRALSAVADTVAASTPAPVRVPTLDAARHLSGTSWIWTAPETRAGVLLTLALSARDAATSDVDAVADAVDDLDEDHPMAHPAALALAVDLHRAAVAHDMTNRARGTRAWFGASFPAPPYPGTWGRLASSVAFDEDGTEDLGAALVLSVLVHRAASRAGGAS